MAGRGNTGGKTLGQPTSTYPDNPLHLQRRAGDLRQTRTGTQKKKKKRSFDVFLNVSIFLNKVFDDKGFALKYTGVKMIPSKFLSCSILFSPNLYEKKVCTRTT